MILDPNKEGIEVYYYNKIRNLTGYPEKCIEWIILECCEELEWDFNNTLDDSIHVVYYKGKSYEQITRPYLDCDGIGRVYEDMFDRIGFLFHKTDIKRVNL
jgi:hypothetical protein